MGDRSSHRRRGLRRVVIAAVALLPVALYLHDAAYRAFVKP